MAIFDIPFSAFIFERMSLLVCSPIYMSTFLIVKEAPSIFVQLSQGVNDTHCTRIRPELLINHAYSCTMTDNRLEVFRGKEISIQSKQIGNDSGGGIVDSKEGLYDTANGTG